MKKKKKKLRKKLKNINGNHNEEKTENKINDDILQTPKLKLEWNVSYKINPKTKNNNCGKKNKEPKSTEKVILENVVGYANPGEFLAIMGPTGSGKTSLLNVLARRCKKGVSGQILVNREKPTKNYKRQIGYVLQQDILFETLTVDQTFSVTARLRLPKELTKEEKMKKVDDVIRTLNLGKVRNTIVGGVARRGVSGGEKKRVNIGNELLTNPSILMLDEPTSGLDTSTAIGLVMELKELAKQGLTIIATIHQPSSQIFEAFDKLLLLVDGREIFFGRSNEAIQYFSSLGLHCSPFYNPADFMMGLILAEEKKEENTIKKK